MTKLNRHAKNRFLIGLSHALTSMRKSAIMQAMNVIFRAENEKFPRWRQHYATGLSRAFVEAAGHVSLKREAAFH